MYGYLNVMSVLNGIVLYDLLAGVYIANTNLVTVTYIQALLAHGDTYHYFT